MTSIRRRLLTALLAALAGAGIIGALATYASAREEVDTLLDEELRQVALSLRDHAQLDPARLTRGGNDPQLRVLVQIWDPAFERPVQLARHRATAARPRPKGIQRCNIKDGPGAPIRRDRARRRSSPRSRLRCGPNWPPARPRACCCRSC
jgi:hypothetical protein